MSFWRAELLKVLSWLKELSLTTPRYVADRTALKALDTTKDTVALLKESGREGKFVWRSGNYSAQIAADTVEAIFIKATAVAATAGAWVRMDGGWAITGIDVRWAGVVVDGLAGSAAANTSALQAVSNLAVALGANLRFPGSSVALYVTSGLTVNGTVRWLGSGTGNCIIKATSATADILVVSAAAGEINFEMERLAFDSSVTRTAGYYVKLNSCSGVRIDNCVFANGYDAIGITGTAYQNIHVKSCVFANTAHNGINVLAATGTQGEVDIVLQNLWMHGLSAVSQSNCAVHIESAGDILLDHVNVIWSHNAVEIVPPTGQVVQAANIDNCSLDTGNGFGLYVGPSGTGVVQLLKLTSTWACSNTLGGIVLGASTGTVVQTELTSCTVSGNGVSSGDGLLINSGATNTNIIGGSYSGNFGHGIAVAANTNKFKINGTICGPSGQFGANGSYGIAVAAGTSDNYDILGCTVTGNTTGALIDGGSGANKRIKNNRGYINEARGAVTATTDANGDIAITHGMSGTPTVVLATRSLALTTGEIQVHTIGATTFNIRFWNSAGTADASVSRSAMWSAYGPGALN